MDNSCKILFGFTALLLIDFNSANSQGSNAVGIFLISECVCNGYTVTYNCSIFGGGNTIWNGSAFNCPSNSDSSNNQILLRHSGFGIGSNSMGICNGGAITGEGVSSKGGYFTSQLNVIVSSNLVGQQVSCYHENGSAELLVGTAMIELSSADDLSSPSNISMTKASHERLTFSWTPVTHSCSALHYIINSEDCGDCPSTVNTTTVDCFMIEQVQPNDITKCIISVRAALCENNNSSHGNLSSRSFLLRVPDAPVTTVIPTYLHDSGSLLKIKINFTELLSSPISAEISSSPVSYNISFFTSESGDIMCYSGIILPTSYCKNGVCSKDIDISSTRCSSFNQIYLSVFATNLLGNGKASESRIIDGTNNFVDIKFDAKNSTVECKFLDQSNTKNIDTMLACSIDLQICQSSPTSALTTVIISGKVTNKTNILKIELNFVTMLEKREYCYTITASNNISTVKVNGTFFRGVPAQSGGGIVDIITGSVIGAIIIILLLCIITILSVTFVVKVCYNKHKYSEDIVGGESVNFGDEEKIDSKYFKIIKVEKDCELAKRIEDEGFTYKRGCAYYQFTRNDERITKDQVIIFQKWDSSTEHGNFFKSKEAERMLGVKDKGETRNPKFKNHTIFVQSRGIGRRPLYKGTILLYDVNNKLSQPLASTTEQLPIPVKSSRNIIKINVPRACSLLELIEDIYDKKFRPGCVFFEFTHKKEDIDPKKEVILMRKDNEKELVTGPGARQIVIKGSREKAVPKPDLKNWRVFVQSLYFGCRHLDARSCVLYEQPKPDEEEFEVCSSEFKKFFVNRDCQLIDFVEEHELEYDDLTVFYFEFTSRVEFIKDMGVILMNKNEELLTGPNAKAIIGAHGREVNNPYLKEYRVFIQNGGAGTRFLRARSLLLYKIPQHGKNIESESMV